MNERIEAFLNKFRPTLTGNFKDQTFVLDNRTIMDASFTNCTMIYGGTGNVSMTNGHMHSGHFEFFGAAAGALSLMQGITSSGGEEMICKTFPEVVDYLLSKGAKP